jgi:hypothetical protein
MPITFEVTGSAAKVGPLTVRTRLVHDSYVLTPPRWSWSVDTDDGDQGFAETREAAEFAGVKKALEHLREEEKRAEQKAREARDAAAEAARLIGG